MTARWPALLLCCLLAVAPGHHGRADDVLDGADRVRDVGVTPDELTQRLSDGTWEAIPRAELDSLLRAAARAAAPPPASIQTAEYTATVVGDTLHSGTLRAEIRTTAEAQTLIPLDPLNLAIRDLEWNDGPAVWGTTPQGGTALFVERSGRLNGRWSLKGRRQVRGVEFPIEVPPAAVSRLHLRLPSSLALAASAGTVTGPLPDDQPGMAAWRIELGSQTACRLHVAPAVDDSNRKPVLLAQTDTTYVVRSDAAIVQSDFVVEVAEAPAAALTVAVPPELDVHSIQYGESAVAWSRKPGPSRHVLITLPEPLLGRGRTIRILGAATVPAGQPWKLPVLQLLDAAFLGGSLNVTVQHPFQMRLLETEACRQTGRTTDSGTETASFEQYRAAAAPTVEIGLPEVSLSHRSLSLLHVSGSRLSLTTEIEWQARSGATFFIMGELAPGWDIQDVRSVKESPGARVAHWSVEPGPNGRRRLALEFVESLDPERPKSVRILAARTLPAAGRAVTVPAIDWPGMAPAGVWIAVSHPPSLAPAIRPAADWETLSIQSPPDFVRSATIWQADSTRGDPNLLLSASGSTPSAQIVFEAAEPPLNAHVRVKFELQNGQAAERALLQLTPAGGALERARIYLTAEGPPPEWTIEDQRGQWLPLAATRIPPSEHAVWDLPADGELWEIRLPEPRSGRVTIQAERRRTLAASEWVSLAVVPGAKSFQGTVELHAPPEMALRARPLGLRPARNDVAAAAKNAAPPPRRWRYRKPSDRLQLVVPQLSSERNGPVLATLRVQSLLHPGRQGLDVHWARYRITPGDDPASLTFELPEDVVMTAMRLDGRVVVAAPVAGVLALPPLEGGRAHEVELQYRIASAGGLLQERHPLPLPRSELTIVDFDWQFALPPGTELAAEPTAVTLETPQSALPWTRRLFGVLGRPADDAAFHPFRKADWQRLLDGDVEPEREQHPVSTTFEPPPGWTIVSAGSPGLPASLAIDLWYQRRIALLAWVCLFGTATAGLVVRALRLRFRTHLAALGMAACTAAALSAPAVWAEVAGSCLVGAVIAAIVPRGLLVRSRLPQRNDDPVPMGSTASFRYPSAPTALIAVCLGLATATVAQDTSRPPAAADLPVGDGRITVLVPLGSKAESTRSAMLVYVRRDELARLRQQAGEPHAPPDALIASATYDGRVDSQRSATIEATFRIAVLDPGRTATVALPIANANLGGDGACLVDGRPHPLFPAPAGEGFVLVLETKSNADELASTAEPAIAEKPSEQAHPTSELAVRWHTVTLQFNPSTKPHPGGGVLEIDVPPVAASDVRMQFAEPFLHALVPTSIGPALVDRDHRTLQAQLGQSERLQIVWSSSTETAQPAPALEARIAVLADLHPSWVQVRCRVAYRAAGTPLQELEWSLPPGAVLRKLSAEHLAGHTMTALDGSNRLLMQFSQPLSGDFTVEAAWVLPLTPDDEGRLTLPPVVLHDPSATMASVSTSLLHVGVTRPAEFRLTSLNSDALQPISPETFAAGAAASTFGVPDAAWQLVAPAPLQFQLTLLTPERRVRKTQEGRIGRTAVDWTMTAEIQTSTAPAFSHALDVDPELQIASISVKEDGAERLVRWSRRGRRVDLLLSDRTAGTQDVTLRGTLPITAGEPVSLPTVDVADADTAESNLLLFRDPQVDVELLDNSLHAVAESSGAPSADGRSIRVGQYRLTNDAPPLRIRTAERDVPSLVDSATLIEPLSERRWQINTVLRFQIPGDVPRPASLRIPAALAATAQWQTSEPVEITSEALPDGSLDLKLELPRSSGLELTVVAELPAPLIEDWPVPAITTGDLEPGERYLVLSPPQLARPAARADLVPSGRLPEWIARFVVAELEPKPFEVFRSDGALRLILESNAAAPVAVPLIHHDLRATEDGRIAAVSRIAAAVRVRERLELDWPDAAKLTAALLDGRPAPGLVSLQDGRMSLDIPPGAHAISLHWSQRYEAPGFRTTLHAALPRLRTHAPARALVTLAAPLDAWPARVEGCRQTGPLEQQLTLLEGWLDAADEAARVGGALPEIAAAAQQLDARLHAQQSDPAGDEFTRSAPLRRRFADARARAARLFAALVQPAESPSEPLLSAKAVALPLSAGQTHRAILYGQLPGGAEPNRVSVQFYDDRLFYGSAIIIAFLVLVPIFRRLLRFELAEWLDAHRPIAWCLLGGVWWACFAPSFAGLLIFAAAAAVLLYRRLRRSRATVLS